MDDESTEVVEATDSTEDTELEEGTVENDTEDVDALRLRLEEAEDAKRQLTARAHKAEAALKAKKAEAPQVINNNTLDSDAVDVKILQSQGMSDELIKELKALAKVRGTSILATQSDPIFVAIKEKQEADEKKAKASLGASHGSGSAKVKKGFNTPGLSAEEHREMWRQNEGK